MTMLTYPHLKSQEETSYVVWQTILAEMSYVRSIAGADLLVLLSLCDEH